MMTIDDDNDDDIGGDSGGTVEYATVYAKLFQNVIKLCF